MLPTVFSASDRKGDKQPWVTINLMNMDGQKGQFAQPTDLSRESGRSGTQCGKSDDSLGSPSECFILDGQGFEPWTFRMRSELSTPDITTRVTDRGFLG